MTYTVESGANALPSLADFLAWFGGPRNDRTAVAMVPRRFGMATAAEYRQAPPLKNPEYLAIHIADATAKGGR